MDAPARGCVGRAIKSTAACMPCRETKAMQTAAVVRKAVSRGLLQRLFDGAYQLRFGHGADDLFLDRAAFEDDQIWNSTNAIARRGGGMIVDVELRDF